MVGSSLDWIGTCDYCLARPVLRAETTALVVSQAAPSGAATAWNPNGNDTVFTRAVSGSSVYVGGNFNSINGTPSRGIAFLAP